MSLVEKKIDDQKLVIQAYTCTSVVWKELRDGLGFKVLQCLFYNLDIKNPYLYRQSHIMIITLIFLNTVAFCLCVILSFHKLWMQKQETMLLKNTRCSQGPA